MGFEITIKSNTPLVGENEKEIIARLFLENIGYITKGSEPTIPLSLFMDCFMNQPDKPWVADEISVKLDTSIPTVYRHLNKLKSLDILEEVKLEDPETKQIKKGYKLRYSNLTKAWTFVEAHVSAAMENYRRTVDHLQQVVDQQRRMGSVDRSKGKKK
jgi:hypothetical protein